MPEEKVMPDDRQQDNRSDLEQAVAARADAVEAGEGGDEASALEPTGVFDGVGGTGGEVKNQDRTQQ